MPSGMLSVFIDLQLHHVRHLSDACSTTITVFQKLHSAELLDDLD